MISTLIPCYEMDGMGVKFLKHSLDIISRQTYKDFEVIVADNSVDEEIKDLCRLYPFVRHYYNSKRGSSANLNFAIGKAKGDIIKILFQDDFLYSNEALEKIAKAFKGGWLVTACEHSTDGYTFYRPFYPKYNPLIHLGLNTISSPSVLAFENKEPLLFDEELVWLMDCDYYKRLHKRYGEPTILNEILAVNRTGAHQVSHTIANQYIRDKEDRYIRQKYA
jgi:glycosyltransferase involved in cell wall biosynthesis